MSNSKSVICIACGKLLTDSIETGCGSTDCMNRNLLDVNERKDALFNNRSAYSYVVDNDGFVCIIDSDIGKSVTNNALAVVQDLKAAGIDLAENRVIYRDTMGVWDEMVIEDGRFKEFRSINERDVSRAKFKARQP